MLVREGADIGIFICVATPTREMLREAAAGGVWTNPVTGVDYPRLQIFTLSDFFDGRRPYVPLLDRSAGYRSTKREDEKSKAQASLF